MPSVFNIIRGQVDPNPANRTTIQATSGPYWLEWWKRENKDTDPARDFDWGSGSWQPHAGVSPPNPPHSPGLASGLGARGLHESMFEWPLKPAHARAIWEFRNRISSIDPSKVHVPPDRLGALPADVSLTHKARAKAQAKLDADKQKQANLKKQSEQADAALHKPGPPGKPPKTPTQAQQDKAANLHKQLAELEASIGDTTKQIAVLDEQIRAYEDDNRTDIWVFGGDASLRSVADGVVATETDGFGQMLASCFHIFLEREGYPNSINTWDGTFTYGVGFNITSSADLMKVIFQPPKTLPENQQIALDGIRTYLRKLGVDFSFNGNEASATIAHVEKRGDKFLGWVLQDTNGVPEGVRKHGIGVDSIRHHKAILDAFVYMGTAVKLPDQEDASRSEEIRKTIVNIQWQIFRAKLNKTFQQYNLVCTKALFVYLVHIHHFGGMYSPDQIITWSISRRLVTGKIEYFEGPVKHTADVPIALRSAGVGSDEMILTQGKPKPGAKPKSKKQKGKKGAPAQEEPEEPARWASTATVQKRTVEIDIQLARLAFLYSIQRSSTSLSWQTTLAMWRQFKQDLKSLDGVKDEDIQAIPFPLRPKAKAIEEMKAEIAEEDDAPSDDAELERMAAARIEEEYVLVNVEKAGVPKGESLQPGIYVALRKADKLETSAIRKRWSLLKDLEFVIDDPNAGQSNE